MKRNLYVLIYIIMKCYILLMGFPTISILQCSKIIKYLIKSKGIINKRIINVDFEF